MKTFPALALTTLSLAGLIAVAGVLREPAASAARTVAIEDADVLRVERLFSNGGPIANSAPKIWSSRLEIRWQARWEASPRYAV